jgi:hypothetical protein
VLISALYVGQDVQAARVVDDVGPEEVRLALRRLVA